MVNFLQKFEFPGNFRSRATALWTSILPSSILFHCSPNLILLE